MYSVSKMCKIMSVSRSGYYSWKYSKPCARHNEDNYLMHHIKLIFEEGRGVYGTRRIKYRLQSDGLYVSRRRISRIMRQAGLACITRNKFKSTTDSTHNNPVAPNVLARNFEVSKPNQVWCGDITYIKTGEGWLYLATVMDLYSRKIVGWSMSNRINAELVNKALLMATWQRKPGKDLIWHTDRGVQYTSSSHLRIIDQHSITQSMSKKGDCWDNAVAESFFNSLKSELIYHHNFKTREEAKNVIFEYIEVFYNQVRTHSNNNYLSPVDFENNKNMLLLTHQLNT